MISPITTPEDNSMDYKYIKRYIMEREEENKKNGVLKDD